MNLPELGDTSVKSQSGKRLKVVSLFQGKRGNPCGLLGLTLDSAAIVKSTHSPSLEISQCYHCVIALLFMLPFHS